MISAVVLAAGLSRRMGTNKLLLPFQGKTVLAQVVAVLRESALDRVLVVMGHEAGLVQAMLGRYWPSGVDLVYNPHYATGDMLSSIQAGLAALPVNCDAALISLGDQPQIEQRIVEQVIAGHEPGKVIIPSFHRRGGHPILIDRARWPDVLHLPFNSNLRQVLRDHAEWVRYIDVDTETILRDIDTPQDYDVIARGDRDN